MAAASFSARKQLQNKEGGTAAVDHAREGTSNSVTGGTGIGMHQIKPPLAMLTSYIRVLA